MSPLALFDQQTASMSELEAVLSSSGLNSTSKRTHNKQVTFNEIVTVCKITHISQYSDQEVINCWYTDEEFHLMKEIAHVCAERLGHYQESSILSQDDDDFFWRGLEGLTSEGLESRRKNLDTGANAVLDEQDLQFEDGVCDPDYIAYLYNLASSRAEAKAHATGLRDHIDAIR